MQATVWCHLSPQSSSLARGLSPEHTAVAGPDTHLTCTPDEPGRVARNLGPDSRGHSSHTVPAGGASAASSLASGGGREFPRCVHRAPLSVHPDAHGGGQWAFSPRRCSGPSRLQMPSSHGAQALDTHLWEGPGRAGPWQVPEKHRPEGKRPRPSERVPVFPQPAGPGPGAGGWGLGAGSAAPLQVFTAQQPGTPGLLLGQGAPLQDEWDQDGLRWPGQCRAGLTPCSGAGPEGSRSEQTGWTPSLRSEGLGGPCDQEDPRGAARRWPCLAPPRARTRVVRPGESPSSDKA